MHRSRDFFLPRPQGQPGKIFLLPSNRYLFCFNKTASGSATKKIKLQSQDNQNVLVVRRITFN